MNIYEKSIMDMYIYEHIGQAAQCVACRKITPNLSHPISIWHVGTRYEQSLHRILFVGKAARGSLGQASLYRDTVEDGTTVAEDLYNTSGWAFWSYTKAVADALYGEGKGWDQLALTNMVKCNSSETIDTSIETTRRSCAIFLRREIELLCPKHIVFYTNSGYDEAIQSVFDTIGNSQYGDYPCGKKMMHCWTFTGIVNGSQIRVIRAGHPERMNKAHFTGKIIRFIRGER